MERQIKAKVTIVGGSNSAHSIIPLLTDAGHSVSLLTRRPKLWQSKIEMKYLDHNGLLIGKLTGEASLITDNPELVIPEADIIILCLPVSKYRIVLHEIAPYVNEDHKTIIGTIYGQAGFNWMVEEIKQKFNLKNIEYFAVGLIPWITRTEIYGRVGINYGPKVRNVVALSNPENFQNLNEMFLEDLCFRYFKTGRFYLAENFISLTLSVDNQIIHLSRLYGLHMKHEGKWQNPDKVPLFYKDYDDLSAQLLSELDGDYEKIRESIKKLFPDKEFTYMLNYLDLEHFSYDSKSTDIKSSFVESKTLGQIPTPVVKNSNGFYVFDKDHRFFLDDLYYGLEVAKWIAEKLELATPTLDKIIYWAQEVVHDKIIENERLVPNNKNIGLKFLHGSPASYGYDSINQIID